MADTQRLGCLSWGKPVLCCLRRDGLSGAVQRERGHLHPPPHLSPEGRWSAWVPPDSACPNGVTHHQAR